MKRSRALRWFDSVLELVARGGVFIWQGLTPGYRVLKPARNRANDRSRRSR